MVHLRDSPSFLKDELIYSFQNNRGILRRYLWTKDQGQFIIAQLLFPEADYSIRLIAMPILVLSSPNS
jgi:hypothetical protein